MATSRGQGDDRVGERADDAPAEEVAAGRTDPRVQAAAILADSDEREAGREESGGEVEHRTGSGDGLSADR